MPSRDKSGNAGPAEATSNKSKISKEPSVEFEISEEDLDKASGGSGLTIAPPVEAATLNGCTVRPGRR